MNLFTALAALPRQSRLAIAADIIRELKPTCNELGRAVCCSSSAVRRWVDGREPFMHSAEVIINNQEGGECDHGQEIEAHAQAGQAR